MPLTLRVAATTLPARAVKLLAGGALRPVRAIRMMRGGELVVVATFGQPGQQTEAITAQANPQSAYGAAQTLRPRLVTSNPVTVTPTGGVAPYSYTWTMLDGDRIVIGSPTMASTSFRASLYQEAATGTAQCVVTDAVGNTATVQVPVELYHEGYGDGPIP